jgi:hypothetical protein
MLEERRVPVTGILIVEINPRARTRPAVPLIIAATLCLDVEPLAGRFVMHMVAGLTFDMWILDGHHLAALGRDCVNELCGLWEIVSVPCEVLLSVRVLNIEPQDVVRNIVLIEASVNVKTVV